MTTTTLNPPRITNLYFYVPGRYSPMDIVCLDPNSNTPPTSDDYFGLYSKKSLSDFQSEYPNIVILTGEVMSTRIYEAAKNLLAKYRLIAIQICWKCCRLFAGCPLVGILRLCSVSDSLTISLIYMQKSKWVMTNIVTSLFVMKTHLRIVRLLKK